MILVPTDVCLCLVATNREWVSWCSSSCIAGLVQDPSQLPGGFVVELRGIHSSDCELLGQRRTHSRTHLSTAACRRGPCGKLFFAVFLLIIFVIFLTMSLSSVDLVLTEYQVVKVHVFWRDFSYLNVRKCKLCHSVLTKCADALKGK